MTTHVSVQCEEAFPSAHGGPAGKSPFRSLPGPTMAGFMKTDSAWCANRTGNTGFYIDSHFKKHLEISLLFPIWLKK